MTNWHCTKGAHVYSKYPSLAHDYDKSILKACCQLESLDPDQQALTRINSISLAILAVDVGMSPREMKSQHSFC